MGGLLMILGAIGEWIMGNTYPFVLFGAYGKPFAQFDSPLPRSIPNTSTLKSIPPKAVKPDIFQIQAGSGSASPRP